MAMGKKETPSTSAQEPPQAQPQQTILPDIDPVLPEAPVKQTGGISKT